MNQQLARTGGTSGFGGTQTTISQQRSTVTQNFAKPKRKKSGRKKQGGGNEEKEFADLTTKKNLGEYWILILSFEVVDIQIFLQFS